MKPILALLFSVLLSPSGANPTSPSDLLQRPPVECGAIRGAHCTPFIADASAMLSAKPADTAVVVSPDNGGN